MNSVVIALFFIAAAVGAVTGSRVGAVQHVPSNGTTPSETLSLNVQQYIALAVQAGAGGDGVLPLDLLVFPEFGLFGPFDYGQQDECAEKLAPFCFPVPLPGQQIPCDNSTTNSSSPLVQLACGPRSLGYLSLTISINLCERNSTANVTGHYNTQVVLKGRTIIAVYRKFHVWDTKCFDRPELELVTFRLREGSPRIGIFTCFDILFTDPKQKLIAEGVQYFSYSSAIPYAEVPVDLFSWLNRVTVINANLQLGFSAIYVNGTEITKSNQYAGDSIAYCELPGL